MFQNLRRSARSLVFASTVASVFVLALPSHAAVTQGAERARAQEPHHRLDARAPGHERDVALTLDACGGAVDRPLIATLVRLRVPATIFMTRRWIDRNPGAVQELLAHPDLFELQNHGAAHVPAVVGGKIYRMRGAASLAAVEHEVADGAAAVVRVGGTTPGWYRGAGAVYDLASEGLISKLGFRIAGFSLNADDGATLPAVSVARRLKRIKPGDIVIAHMNKPGSGTAAGFAAALPELQARGIVFVKFSQAAGVLGTR